MSPHQATSCIAEQDQGPKRSSAGQLDVLAGKDGDAADWKCFMTSMNGQRIPSVAQVARVYQSSLYDRTPAAAKPACALPWRSPWFASGTWGMLLCVVYPLLVLAPLLAFAFVSPSHDDAPVVKIAVNCAVVAFSILAMQFLLMARFRWIEAPFGLDVILRFHQGMALVAVCLICAHPLLLTSRRKAGDC